MKCYRPSTKLSEKGRYFSEYSVEQYSKADRQGPILNTIEGAKAGIVFYTP